MPDLVSPLVRWLASQDRLKAQDRASAPDRLDAEQPSLS
jgi:hypothetical protein